MLSVSEQGYGKQTPITTYRLQSRGGKGVINMKTTEKTGKVVAVFPVEDESEIAIITAGQADPARGWTFGRPGAARRACDSSDRRR